MTSTTAKKLRAGCYEYRGWIIEKVSSDWFMKPKSIEFWTDAASTLSDAKLMIDKWETTTRRPNHLSCIFRSGS